MALPETLLRAVRIAPYSVLGSQLTRDRRVVHSAPPPGPDCLFVDPAGLPFIQELGPGAAAGASGAIYDFLGIRDDDDFPEPVRDAVRAVCDARWHAYRTTPAPDEDEEDGAAGEVVRNCCHVVGPNFNAMFPPLPFPDADGAVDDPQRAQHEAEGLAALTRVYANVLREFARSQLPALRLLPVSGGIFAGKLRDQMPELTFSALRDAAAELGEADAAAVSAAAAGAPPGGIEMCIFEEAQLELFEAALEKAIGTLG